jgi:hypothetical protein
MLALGMALPVLTLRKSKERSACGARPSGCLPGGAVVAITTSWRVHSPGPFGPGPLRRASQHQRFPTEGCPHGEHGQTPWRSRSFTPEFKAEMVALHQSGDWFIGQVARDFGVTEAAVRE